MPPVLLSIWPGEGKADSDNTCPAESASPELSSLANKLKTS